MTDATHFIVIWNVLGTYGQSKRVYSLTEMDIITDCFTIAVWHIKRSDTPIEARLGKRIMGRDGYWAHPEFFRKANEMAIDISKNFNQKV